MFCQKSQNLHPYPVFSVTIRLGIPLISFGMGLYEQGLLKIHFNRCVIIITTKLGFSNSTSLFILSANALPSSLLISFFILSLIRPVLSQIVFSFSNISFGKRQPTRKFENSILELFISLIMYFTSFVRVSKMFSHIKHSLLFSGKLFLGLTNF